MENLLFIANTVLPVFLIVFLGIFLRKNGLVDDNFVNHSSRIVFNISLPVLVFLELSRLDADTAFEFDQILFVYAGTIFSFILSWVLSKPLIQDSLSSMCVTGS
ncbi:AEC family transporter, partial [bacterium]|nr:AEC family transporter [bacterium]